MSTPAIDTSDIPRPSLPRRLWIRGLQFGNETDAQMDERERRWAQEDAARQAEEERLWKWKIRPWWEDAK